MLDLLDSIKYMSSGTMATLIGKTNYDEVDAVFKSFREFAEGLPKEMRWQDAWEEYQKFLSQNNDNVFAISEYTRKQAIEDELLFDVTDMAKDVGFKYPVALTAAVVGIVKDIPKKYSYQSYGGRLYDLLFVAHLIAKNSRIYDELHFKISVPHHIDNEKCTRVVNDLELKAVCGPGDDSRPVITIMMPYED